MFQYRLELPVISLLENKKLIEGLSDFNFKKLKSGRPLIK